MKLVVYPKLSTRSRRAIRRVYWKFGNFYEYKPRGNLIERLAKQLQMSKSDVLDQIQKERQFLIKDLLKKGV